MATCIHCSYQDIISLVIIVKLEFISTVDTRWNVDKPWSQTLHLYTKALADIDTWLCEYCKVIIDVVWSITKINHLLTQNFDHTGALHL